jgi:hypothetical protein
MFQTCLPNQKVERKKHGYIFEFLKKCNDCDYQNINIKNIIKLSNSIQPSKYNHKIFLMKNSCLMLYIYKL